MKASELAFELVRHVAEVKRLVCQNVISTKTGIIVGALLCASVVSDYSKGTEF